MRSFPRNVAAAAELGLRVRAGRGHVHIVDADGHLVAVASSTPRDPDTALRRLRADLRRHVDRATEVAS
jgi:hypothetical protein